MQVKGSTVVLAMLGPALLAAAIPPCAGAEASPGRDVLVGANYFAGWWEEKPNKWQDTRDGHEWLKDFPERTPLLGRYNTQATMDREIAAAADHGVDFFSMLWYPPSSARGNRLDVSERLNRAAGFFQNSTNAHRMMFTLEYCNHPPFDKQTDEEWAAQADGFVQSMKHTSYLRVGGRPVFLIHSSLHFYEACGKDTGRCQGRLDVLRNKARAAGLGELTVGGGGLGPLPPGHWATKLFAFSGTYMDVNPHVQDQGTDHPYQLQADHVAAFRAQFARSTRPYLPFLCAGWNPRPWRDPRPTFALPTRAEWRGELMRMSGELAKTANFGIPRPDGTVQKACMIYAWNEFGEGGFLAPTQGDGYMKLECIREVFGGKPGQAAAAASAAAIPPVTNILSLAGAQVPRDYEPFVRDVMTGKQRLRGAMVLLGEVDGSFEMAVRDLKRLKSYGANHVRLYFNPTTGLTGEECRQYGKWVKHSNATNPSPEWLQITGEILKKRWLPLFAELDLPVILMVYYPEDASKDPRGAFWSDAVARQRLVGNAVAEAAFFKNEPAIIGYDLLNEPIPPGCENKSTGLHPWRWSEAQARADLAGGEHVLADIYNDMIRGIRAFDRQRLLVLEPGPWGLPWAFPALLQVQDDPRLVFGCHQYEPHGFTHWAKEAWETQDPALLPPPERRPHYPDAARKWDRQLIADMFDTVETFRKAREKQTGRHCPVWIGEFGTWRWLDKASQLNWYRDSLELMEARGYGWAYFVYDAGLSIWWNCMTQDGPEGEEIDLPAYLQARKTLDRKYFESRRHSLRPSFEAVVSFMRKNQEPPESAAPLTVGPGGVIRKDGKPYRAIGVNYADAFWRRIKNPKDTSYREGFADLARRGIPFARFSAAPFYPVEWKLYQQDKEAYFRLLDDVVRAAEENHIGLIPSVGSWWPCGIPDLVGEPVGQLGNPVSKTTAFVRQYATEVVTRYRGSPAIWAWEMGNEYSLQADLTDPKHWSPTVVSMGAPAKRTAADIIRHEDVVVASREFALAVRAVDKLRPITTGHSLPRPVASHLHAEGKWQQDTPMEFATNLLVVTPAPNDMVSVHLYRSEEKLRFGKPFPPYTETLSLAVQAARREGKALFVGEFGATDAVPATREKSAREEHLAMLDAIEKSGVPLAAVWVYDFPHQGADWNISPTNSRAALLDLVAAANARLADPAGTSGGGGPAVQTEN